MKSEIGTLVYDEVVCPIIKMWVERHAIWIEAIVPKEAQGTTIGGRFSIFGRDGKEFGTWHNVGYYETPKVSGNAYIQQAILDAESGHPDPQVTGIEFFVDPRRNNDT